MSTPIERFVDDHKIPEPWGTLLILAWLAVIIFGAIGGIGLETWSPHI